MTMRKSLNLTPFVVGCVVLFDAQSLTAAPEESAFDIAKELGRDRIRMRHRHRDSTSTFVLPEIRGGAAPSAAEVWAVRWLKSSQPESLDGFTMDIQNG
jgi:hypothetical protein